jgi:hypothetical protein
MPDVGVRLQLFVGPTVPIPAPFAVVDALTTVEITDDDRERSGFQLTFSLGKDTPLDYSLLAGGLLDPPSRVVVLLLLLGTPQVLIDGIITRHQVTPSNRPGDSTLHVTGEDVTLMMDLEEKSSTYPNQPDSVIVTRLIASYATYGLIPRVTPTTDVPIILDRIPTQQRTDLAYIRELARRNGYVFYVEPTPLPGTNTAYWGPDNRLDVPQPALTLNMGPLTNVDEPIAFRYDSLGPVAPQVFAVEPITQLRFPIPVPTGLHPPLARSPATPLRKTVTRDSANLSTIQAGLRAASAAGLSSDAVEATGHVDAVRYGQVLRARRLVGVRGVGQSYDGTYYVRRVTHMIRRGSYRQEFVLSREGRGSLTPAVRP